MTCKDCINHDKCEKQHKLMLTIDDICELVYQHGVEKSCPHFIKADKVCKDCINYDECLACKVNAKECLLFKNKADFVEVKHGKWITRKSIHNEEFYVCSICGTANDDIWRYCPNCGAKMDGGAE